MRRWFPVPSISRWIGLVLLLLALALTAAVGRQLAAAFTSPPDAWPIDFGLYLQVVLFLALAIISGALAYRVVAAFTLSYDLDRNGLYVNWLGNRAVVPLDQVSHIDAGLGEVAKGWTPFSAIGYNSGQRQLPDGRTIHRFSTAANARSLVIHTAEALYVISPRDADGFVQDLEQRRNLGSAKTLNMAVEPGRMFLYAFWHDRTVRTMLLVAFVVNLLVLGLLAARYPGLDASIQMRFNAVGQVAELRPRHDLLFLPLAAFLLSLINTLLGLSIYRSQQLGARLLQGASVVVQVLFGIAILTIIR